MGFILGRVYLLEQNVHMYKEKTLTNCLACDGKTLTPFLNLGVVPLANNLGADDKFPLIVNYCNDCAHAQLSVAVDPELLFSNYLYVSGTTKTLKEHFYNLACAIYNELGTTNISHLDIASNDGSLCVEFANMGFRSQGIDPAKNLSNLAFNKGVPTLVDFWSYETSNKVNKFNVITALNVLAHTPDPYDFLLGCANALLDNGWLIVEMPNTDKFMEDKTDGHIYHEHVSYFNKDSLNILCRRAGLVLERREEVPVHGGSTRYWIRKPCKMTTLAYELPNTASRIAKYTQFKMSVLKQRKDLLDYLTEQKSKGEAIAAYGASAKLSTLLNGPFGKEITSCIDLVVDDNKFKWRYCVPGTPLTIYDPITLYYYSKPMTVICSAYNFFTDIKLKTKQVRKHPDYKTTLVSYVPEIKSECL